MDWFDKLSAQQSERYPWMVKFEGENGNTKELQLAGESAQDVANYVREVENATVIYFIAKLDNNWE